MNTRFKTLALSAALLAGVAAAPAHAYVYADARLLINNLTVNITPAAGSTVTNFTFNTQANSALNGATGPAGDATCFGGPGPAGVTNTCTAGANGRLSTVSNAPSGSPTRALMDYTFKGPAGNNQFSNAAASINTANVTFDPSTSISEIAESELQGGLTASASSVIQSVTGFTYTFTLAAPGNFALAFDANPDQYAQIAEAFGGFYSAQSNLSTTFTLAGGNQKAVWTPDGVQGDGVAGGGCSTASGGVTCTEGDSANLNQSIGVTQPGIATSSHDGDANFTHFALNVGGLLAGSYTLTLNSTGSTQLTRFVVPEPDSLLLMGAGVLGLALRSRRKNKSA